MTQFTTLGGGGGGRSLKQRIEFQPHEFPTINETCYHINQIPPYSKLSSLSSLPHGCTAEATRRFSYLVQRLLVEAEGVEGLVVRGLVPPEPLPNAGDVPRENLLHVRDVVQVLRQGVIHVDGNHLSQRYIATIQANVAGHHEATG